MFRQLTDIARSNRTLVIITLMVCGSGVFLLRQHPPKTASLEWLKYSSVLLKTHSDDQRNTFVFLYCSNDINSYAVWSHVSASEEFHEFTLKNNIETMFGLTDNDEAEELLLSLRDRGYSIATPVMLFVSPGWPESEPVVINGYISPDRVDSELRMAANRALNLKF